MARDAAHYRRLVTDNPHASVGVSLAAAAVYAARYGVCEAEDRDSAAWRLIFRDLSERYGESLDASDVLGEMEAVQNEPDVELTTEHAASSYGIPVLLINGTAYGPSDIVPSGELAATYVGRWSLHPGRTSEELKRVARFLGSSLVSPGDIARLTGVETVTVRSWEARHSDFPAPVARTAGGNIYLWAQVEAWLRKTGRIK